MLQRNAKSWAESAFTILVGVIPATLLVPFAALLLFEAVESLLDPEYAVAAMISVPVGVLAILGFVALLHTIRGSIDRNVAWGLAGGILANLIAVVLLTPLVGVSPGSLYLLYVRWLWRLFIWSGICEAD